MQRFLNVHGKYSVAVVLDSAGEQVTEARIPNDPEAYRGFLGQQYTCVTQPEALSRDGFRDWYPGTAISLGEFMKRFDAEYLFRLSRDLHGFMQSFEAPAWSNKVLPNDVRGSLEEGLEALREKLERYELESAIDAVDRMLRSLDSGPSFSLIGLDVRNLFADIQQRAEDDLHRKVVLRLPRERARYYEMHEPLGADVAKRFPEATFDAEESYNCFALGRYNGAVYHMMRVLEVGVRALAAKLQVPLPDDLSWGPIINKCRGEVNSWPAGDRREKYSAVVNHLDGVRGAWRNPTMHPRPLPYGEGATMDILRNSRALMTSLAAILDP